MNRKDEIQQLKDQLASVRIAAWAIWHALERALPYIASQANAGDKAAERQLHSAQAALAAFTGSQPTSIPVWSLTQVAGWDGPFCEVFASEAQRNAALRKYLLGLADNPAELAALQKIEDVGEMHDALREKLDAKDIFYAPQIHMLDATEIELA